jgi:hypothetical protein
LSNEVQWTSDIRTSDIRTLAYRDTPKHVPAKVVLCYPRLLIRSLAYKDTKMLVPAASLYPRFTVIKLDSKSSLATWHPLKYKAVDESLMHLWACVCPSEYLWMWSFFANCIFILFYFHFLLVAVYCRADIMNKKIEEERRFKQMEQEYMDKIKMVWHCSLLLHYTNSFI